MPPPTKPSRVPWSVKDVPRWHTASVHVRGRTPSVGRVGRQAERAEEIARTLLEKPLPRRWAHTQGVAARARTLAPILGDDADLLEAAAWLHDIGYSPALAATGFHPLDGARYLRGRPGRRATPVPSRGQSFVRHHRGQAARARR